MTAFYIILGIIWIFLLFVNPEKIISYMSLEKPENINDSFLGLILWVMFFCFLFTVTFLFK